MVVVSLGSLVWVCFVWFLPWWNVVNEWVLCFPFLAWRRSRLTWYVEDLAVVTGAWLYFMTQFNTHTVLYYPIPDHTVIYCCRLYCTILYFVHSPLWYILRLPFSFPRPGVRPPCPHPERRLLLRQRNSALPEHRQVRVQAGIHACRSSGTCVWYWRAMERPSSPLRT